jgi:hypothetical protein
MQYDVLMLAEVLSDYIKNIYAVSGQRLDIYGDQNLYHSIKITYRLSSLIIYMFCSV